MPHEISAHEEEAAALRRAADEERRLIERERKAEYRLAAAMAKLAAAEEKLARAQDRVKRRMGDVAEAESRLRRRQEARATGPARAGSEASTARRLTPAETVSLLDQSAHSPGHAPTVGASSDGRVEVVAEKTEPDTEMNEVRPPRSRTRRKPPPSAGGSPALG